VAEARIATKLQRRLTPAEIEALLAAYRGGASVPEVCLLLGINRTTVLAQLERAGVSRRPNTAKLSGSRLTQAAQLYEAGLSLASVGQRLEVNAATVRTALAKTGVAIRPRNGWA
jgi:DNA-binding CsgD family transcriptional regulator